MTWVTVFIIGYISLLFSDYQIHRNIMHGRWKLVKFDHPFIRMWLYAHYVQHIKAHHVHSSVRKKELSQGEPVPQEDKQKIEQRYQSQTWSVRGLQCSDHGISIIDHVCLFSFVSLFLLTPHYYIAAMIGFFLDPSMGALVASMVLIPSLNHHFHRFYHMDREAREKHAPKYLRWYFLSKQMDRIAKEHMHHHHSREARDDYYNLLPYGSALLRLVLKRN